MSSFRQSKSQEKWKAIARREVGTSHEATKTPCQDYAGYKQYGDYCIGVVADGAGSRRYSEYGSTVAVDTALRYFNEILSGLHGNSLFTSQNDAEDLFHNLIDQVRTELGTKAGNFSREYKEKISADQFACTLLVFVVFPEGIAAMQLGDGFIVVRDYKSQEYDLLFSPSKGEYVNETTFVTSSPKDIAQDLQIRYRPNPVSFICASTDGLEKVALDLANNKAFARFFIPLEKYIQNTQEIEQDSYITEFLKSEQVNRKTDDDKTILLCSSIKVDPAPEINRTIQESKTAIPLPATQTSPPVIGITEKSQYKTTQKYSDNMQGESIEKQQSKSVKFKHFLKIANQDKSLILGLLIFSNILLVFFTTLFLLILIGTKKYHWMTEIFFWLIVFLIIVYSIGCGILVSKINTNKSIKENPKSNIKIRQRLILLTLGSLILACSLYYFCLAHILN